MNSIAYKKRPEEELLERYLSIVLILNKKKKIDSKKMLVNESLWVFARPTILAHFLRGNSLDTIYRESYRFIKGDMGRNGIIAGISIR